jgi:hypothetical protein
VSWRVHLKLVTVEVGPEKQNSMDIAHPIAINGQYVDVNEMAVNAAPLGIDVDFGYGELSFKERQCCVLGSTNLSFFSIRHDAILLH